MSVSVRSRCLIIAGLNGVLLLGFCHPALGQKTRPEPPVHLELPDDAARPGEKATVHSVPRVQFAAGAGGVSTGVQVNVTASGMNIVGDAGNETSIAVDPTAPNRMTIGWRQFDTISSNFRQAGTAWTNDGGRTWHFPGVIQPGVFRSDPVLGSDSSGWFYYYSLRVAGAGTLVCDMFSSDDGGQTWDDGRFAFGGDKAWMGIDHSGFSSDGNIYLAWSTVANCCGFNNFSRSLDGGLSFMTPIPQLFPAVWGTIAVGPDGEFYISGISSPSDRNDDFVVLKSTTLGDPSGPAFDFASSVDMNGTIALGSGPNPGGLLGQVWIEVDSSNGPNHGNVYQVCSIDPPGNDPLDVHFVRSTDGGLTWSTPIRLNDDSGNRGAWQWFGTMSTAPNGRIDVIWNDTRNDLEGNFSELFYTYSMDGGSTWEPNILLSPPFNHFLGYPNQNKLGDYYHMVSDDVGADLAWAATFNGEQDVYYLRIGDYDCNRNGLPDSGELADDPAMDCNLNGIPDSCELAAGASLDLNDDGLPDDCGDCNENGIFDFLDILDGRSDDCNDNALPDECEMIDCNGNGRLDECDLAFGDSGDCNSNGIPDECEEDCNDNGQPDDCDLGVFTASSGPLGPLGNGFPLSFFIPNAPVALEEVEIIVEASADLAGGERFVNLSLNGFHVANVCGCDGSLCPEQPDRTVIPYGREFFNFIADTDPQRNITFTMVPSPEIDAAACNGESYITLTVRYLSDIDNDQNNNGVPDECDPPVCQGLEATVWVDRDGFIVGGRFDGRRYFGILLGTRGDDVIVGTDGRDVLIGLGGDDVICGLGGDDVINGNRGDDTIDGGDGFDIIHGNGGVDTCTNGERNGSCENGDPNLGVKTNVSR